MVVVHGEFTSRTVTTPVTVWAATNGTSPVLFFEKSFVLGEAKPMFRERTDLASKYQAIAAPVLPTVKSRKITNRFPGLTTLADCGALRNMLVRRLIKPAPNKVQAHGVKWPSRLSRNLPQRKTLLKQLDDPVHIHYLKRKQPDSLVANRSTTTRHSRLL
jgi:hypothetical protein